MKKLFLFLTAALASVSMWAGVNVLSSQAQVIVDGNWTITGPDKAPSAQNNVVFPTPAAEDGFPEGTKNGLSYIQLGSSGNLGAKLSADKRITILGLSAGDIITIYWFATNTTKSTPVLSYATASNNGAKLYDAESITPVSKTVYSSTFSQLTSSDITNIETGYAGSEKLAYISCNNSLYVYAVKITSAISAPSFTSPATEPAAVNYEVGQVAQALSVTAIGGPTPTLQWYSNTTKSTEGATALTGETNATYTPSTAEAGDFYYYCVATNASGSATSHFFHVNVSAAACPSGLEIDGEDEYMEKDAIELTATLSAGNGAITYQWYKGGTDAGDALEGETSETLTIASCELSDAGDYYCIASKAGCAESAVSAAFTITVEELSLVSVSDDISWDFTKIARNTSSSLHDNSGIKLTAESTPSITDEVLYAKYADGDLWTIASGFDGTKIAFTGEFPTRNNNCCQNGTLRFNTTVPGSLVVKFSDTGTGKSSTAVKRYLVINGVTTEYWTSRENNGDEPYAAQLNVTTGEIPVSTGDVTITGTSPIIVSIVTFTKSDETALDNTEASVKAVKFFKDGQLLIEKNGKTYNAQGQVVR